MIVLVRRGDIRAALASVIPHAGKETDDTPELGRVRFAPTPGNVMVWATDHATAAVASARVTSHVDGVLDGWDLSVQACRQVLAVFQGPSNKDARMMWEDGDLQIELLEEQIVVQEVDTFPGRTRLLRVPRIVPAGTDTYPDVPRTVHTLLTVLPSRVRWNDLAGAYEDGTVSVASLSKLVPSGKAWDLDITLARAGGAFLATCGERFTAVVPAVAPGFGGDRDRWGEHLQGTADAWSIALAPLRRPLPPPPLPAGVVDDLKAQASEILRHGTGTLRVVRDADGTEYLELDPDDDGDTDGTLL